MATPKLFPTCYYMDHRTISIRGIYRFYKSPPYRDAADAPPAPAESVTSTPPGLSDPPVPLLNTRLFYRPSIMIPNTVSAAYPPAFRLAGN
jgi:hypothetical protein